MCVCLCVCVCVCVGVRVRKCVSVCLPACLHPANTHLSHLVLIAVGQGGGTPHSRCNKALALPARQNRAPRSQLDPTSTFHLRPFVEVIGGSALAGTLRLPPPPVPDKTQKLRGQGVGNICPSWPKHTRRDREQEREQDRTEGVGVRGRHRERVSFSTAYVK